MPELVEGQGGPRWDAIGQRASSLLADYLCIETTNPPGNEAQAARFLAQVLEAHGIQAQLFSSAPGRANLVARLKGDGSARPLALLHHMDVVPANPSAWEHPPFQAHLEGGYLWGRGALDAKGLGVMQLMAFLMAQAQRLPLKRDLIFLALADEEHGSAQGAQWIVQHHWPQVECEYLWDEGGFGLLGVLKDEPVFGISVTEKKGLGIRLVARGAAGHASTPSSPQASPIGRLVRALYALQRYSPPVRLNPVTRESFRRLGARKGFPASWLLANADRPLVRQAVGRAFSRSPTITAMVRDTVSVTTLAGGYKMNVVPESAEAVLDCRLLPDTDAQAFLRRLKQVVGDDGIEVRVEYMPQDVGASPVDSPMFAAMERAVQRHFPGSLTMPVQVPAATDSRFFRARGVKAYGLTPVVVTPQELAGVHGANERISVEGLVRGIRVVWDVLQEMCT